MIEAQWRWCAKWLRQAISEARGGTPARAREMSDMLHRLEEGGVDLPYEIEQLWFKLTCALEGEGRG